MNTAIRDGRDLGWKLAWVLHGWAGDELLDSYERERRPVAEHNMERSVDPNGSVRSVAEELHVDLGPRIPHVWVEPGRSTLDLLGPGFTLAARARSGLAAAGVASAVTEHRLDAITARAVGLGARGALLARPDGVAADSRRSTGRPDPIPGTGPRLRRPTRSRRRGGCWPRRRARRWAARRTRRRGSR